MKIPSLYSLLLTGGVLLSGCSSVPTRGLANISSSRTPLEIVVERLNTETQKPVQVQQIQEIPQPEVSNQYLVNSNNSIQISHEEIAGDSVLNYGVRPKTEEKKINLESHIDLDIRLNYTSYEPDFREFDLSAVTYGEKVELSPLHTYRYSDYDQNGEVTPQRIMDFKSSYGNSRYVQEQLGYGSSELGAAELKMLLQTAREIIRRLGQKYEPFRQIDRFLVKIEKLGKKLRDIEKGIQDIWTLDLNNIYEDLTNPLGPLKKAMGIEPKYVSIPTCDKVYRLEPVFKGTLEPTLNRSAIGSGSGQDLLALFRGDKEADLGVQLKFTYEF